MLHEMTRSCNLRVEELYGISNEFEVDWRQGDDIVFCEILCLF